MLSCNSADQGALVNTPNMFTQVKQPNLSYVQDGEDLLVTLKGRMTAGLYLVSTDARIEKDSTALYYTVAGYQLERHLVPLEVQWRLSKRQKKDQDTFAVWEKEEILTKKDLQTKYPHLKLN
jgi:hypothetical protein